MSERKQPEPWLRRTLPEIPAVHRAVLHALQLAEEDLSRYCAALTIEELNAQPGGAASVGFHLRHIAGSADRLLTYAEGRQLNEEQFARLRAETEPVSDVANVFAELRIALEHAAARVRALVETDLEGVRTVGRQSVPTTVGGLLVHVADHTQRHVGQAVTTAKFVRSTRTV
jgi:uncharacterized damage-inducible protein DinB